MAGFFKGIVDAVSGATSSVASGLAKGLSAISQATRDPNLTRSGVLPFRDEYRSNTRANTNDTSYVSLRRESSNTVGRFTYQLDKYRKNLMLILHVSCYEGSVDTVTRVKTTFEQFRFQVELHHDQTGDEMRETCHKFFQQDFTEYGAVAVVVVAPAHEGGGEYRCRGSNFRNDDVLRYFWGDDVPATLGPKPKIFLSQADNEIVKHSDVRPALPLREEESHVYELFLPATIYPHPSSSEPSGTCHPLNFLCEKLEELGDRDCFQDIAKKTIREAKERWPSADGRNPGSFDCTDYNMMRSLTFWRTS